MAETLGSLVDKLSIKNLRLWHLDEVKEGDKTAEKKKLVLEQRQRLIEEIDAFTGEAAKGSVPLREEKLKLYNKPEDTGLTGHLQKIGETMDQLCQENIRLWHLEDEIREVGLADTQIVQLKRRIDKSNQKRNDLIDRTDELLEQTLHQPKEDNP